MRRYKSKRLWIAGFLLCWVLISCSFPSSSDHKEEPLVYILSISWEEKEVVLFSNKSLDLGEYVLRQGDTKNIYSLSGIYIEKDIPQKVKVPSQFLRKKNNSLSLSHLQVISSLEEN